MNILNDENALSHDFIGSDFYFLMYLAVDSAYLMKYN
jgi:hypothetical protein